MRHRRLAAALLLSVVLPITPALAHGEHGGGGAMVEADQPIPLLSGWDAHHHPITTSSEEAQRFFDQGLLLAYNFNHADAIRSFERAHELDPEAPMPLWGIAFALGNHINMPADEAALMRAHETVQAAVELAGNASERERAWVEALAVRYGADTDVDQMERERAFREAMRDVVERYPDDIDARVLYAESIMNLRPWAQWEPDGTPAEGTLELVAVLEEVLARDPYHPHANHLYIHAIEASPEPERAHAAAMRLQSLDLPAGHLVHMPTHIYQNTGYFAESSEYNRAAAEADRELFEEAGSVGLYPTMYYSHNLHMIAAADMQLGDHEGAREAAARLRENVLERADEVGPFGVWFVDYFAPVELIVATRFGDWDTVMEIERPEGDTAMWQGFWHIARGHARLAAGDRDEAEAELATIEGMIDALPAEYPYGQSRAVDVLEVGARLLEGRIAQAEGEIKAAILAFELAVAAEDRLAYDEPANWLLPAREALGRALIEDGQPDEAEAVFRAELDKHQRSGRAMLGLAEALDAQGDSEGAALVRRQHERAWANADTSLSLPDL
jgi:tetratricopeptide (TPR) repeat protein